jgi:DNA-binding SARP family transcriptional activator
MPSEALNTNNVTERYFKRMKKDINMTDPFDEFILKFEMIYNEYYDKVPIKSMAYDFKKDDIVHSIVLRVLSNNIYQERTYNNKTYIYMKYNPEIKQFEK